MKADRPGTPPGAAPEGSAIDDPWLRALGQIAREDAEALHRAEASAGGADLLSKVLALTRHREDDLVRRIVVARHAGPATVELEPSAADLARPAPGALPIRAEASGPHLDDLPTGRTDRPSLRVRRQRPWTLLMGGVAVAAAVVVGLSLPSEDRSPLPVYGVSAAGGIKEYRGGSPPGGGHDADDADEESVVAIVQRVGADTELRIVCRPQTAASGQVTARTFLVHDGQSEEIRPKLRIAPTGAIEVTVRGSDLSAAGGGGSGSGRLRVAISRPEHASEIDPKAAVEATASASLRWLTVPVELDHR